MFKLGVVRLGLLKQASATSKSSFPLCSVVRPNNTNKLSSLLLQQQQRSYWTEGNSYNNNNNNDSTYDTTTTTNNNNVDQTTPDSPDSDLPKQQLPPSKIFSPSIVFYSDTGLAAFSIRQIVLQKHQPTVFNVKYPASLVARFLPSLVGGARRYDITRKVQIRIRPVDIGSILEIEPRKVTAPITVYGMDGQMEVLPGDTEGALKLKATPRYTANNHETPETIEVQITTGQLKTLQTTLTHLTPSLFGWNVVGDPNLLPNFVSEQQQQQQPTESDAFFDVFKVAS